MVTVELTTAPAVRGIDAGVKVQVADSGRFAQEKVMLSASCPNEVVVRSRLAWYSVRMERLGVLVVMAKSSGRMVTVTGAAVAEEATIWLREVKLAKRLWLPIASNEVEKLTVPLEPTG